MKFVLILAVAFLALSASVSSSAGALDSSKPYSVKNSGSRNALIEGLAKIIKEIIEKTQETLNDILEKLQEILQNVTDTIQKAIVEANDFINELVNKSLEILDKIAKQDEISRKCVEQNRSDLDLAISKYNLEIQACQDKAFEDAQNIKNDIEPHIEAIRNNIEALEGIVSECLGSNENIFGAVQCIVDKLEEIKTELLKLINSAKDALITGPIRANEIIRDARVCIESSNNKLETRITEVLKNVDKCIEDNQ